MFTDPNGFATPTPPSGYEKSHYGEHDLNCSMNGFNLFKIGFEWAQFVSHISGLCVLPAPVKKRSIFSACFCTAA